MCQWNGSLCCVFATGFISQGRTLPWIFDLWTWTRATQITAQISFADNGMWTCWLVGTLWCTISKSKTQHIIFVHVNNICSVLNPELNRQEMRCVLVFGFSPSCYRWLTVYIKLLFLLPVNPVKPAPESVIKHTTVPRLNPCSPLKKKQTNVCSHVQTVYIQCVRLRERSCISHTEILKKNISALQQLQPKGFLLMTQQNMNQVGCTKAANDLVQATGESLRQYRQILPPLEAWGYLYHIPLTPLSNTAWRWSLYNHKLCTKRTPDVQRQAWHRHHRDS